MPIKVTATVEGLSELGIPEEKLKGAVKEFQLAGTQKIVEAAKRYAAGEGRQQAKAAETLRTLRGNTVKYGGTDWSFGAEYGSYTFKQFPAWRGNGRTNPGGAGYFFSPAVREFQDRTMMATWRQSVWEEIQQNW